MLREEVETLSDDFEMLFEMLFELWENEQPAAGVISAAAKATRVHRHFMAAL